MPSHRLHYVVKMLCGRVVIVDDFASFEDTENSIPWVKPTDPHGRCVNPNFVYASLQWGRWAKLMIHKMTQGSVKFLVCTTFCLAFVGVAVDCLGRFQLSVCDTSTDPFSSSRKAMPLRVLMLKKLKSLPANFPPKLSLLGSSSRLFNLI